MTEPTWSERLALDPDQITTVRRALADAAALQTVDLDEWCRDCSDLDAGRCPDHQAAVEWRKDYLTLAYELEPEHDLEVGA